MTDEENNFEECIENKEQVTEIQPEVIQYTEEQKEVIREEINGIKDQANKKYIDQNYVEAINLYTTCIKMSDSIDWNAQLAKLHMNKGLCFFKSVI
jgi:hypothetical protein